MRLKIVSILAFCIVLIGSAVFGMGTTPKSPQIKIEGQEANFSTMILGSAAIFMKIENAGNSDDALISARVSIPGAIAELHDVEEGKMVKREKIVIPSKSIVELKPKSLHIMLFKIPKDIKEGSEFTLFLMFEKSGEKQVPVKFVKSSHGSHMQHSH